VCLFERNAGRKRCRKNSQWLINRFFGGDIKRPPKSTSPERVIYVAEIS